MNDHLFRKELFILFAASAFRKLSSIYVFSYFPFGFEGRIWDLIVSVPDHCLSFYFSYTLVGTDLENGEIIKYLGVTITSDLRWNTHVSNVCTNANRTLGFLRRNLYSCPQEVKEADYNGLVHPVLDYGSSVWDPPV